MRQEPGRLNVDNRESAERPGEVVRTPSQVLYECEKEIKQDFGGRRCGSDDSSEFLEAYVVVVVSDISCH